MLDGPEQKGLKQAPSLELETQTNEELRYHGTFAWSWWAWLGIAVSRQT